MSPDAFRGFRVEWTDGGSGEAAGLALFVRTVGFGTGRSKVELVSLADVEKIDAAERLLIVRERRSIEGLSLASVYKRLRQRLG